MNTTSMELANDAAEALRSYISSLDDSGMAAVETTYLVGALARLDKVASNIMQKERLEERYRNFRDASLALSLVLSRDEGYVGSERAALEQAVSVLERKSHELGLALDEIR